MNKKVKKELNEILESYGWETEHDIDWHHISVFYPLSEDFIREFQDRVDWHLVGCNQSLSKKFVREFQEKIDWVWMSNWGEDLPFGFICEFSDKLDLNVLIKKGAIHKKDIKTIYLRKPITRFDLIDL
jgi:hypothetical protein